MTTTAFASLSIGIMILLPLGLAIAWRRRYSVPWWLFCLGMATFAGSQLYHFPLNTWLTDLGLIGPISVEAPALVRTAVILGLSAGLSETSARALGYLLLFRRKEKASQDRRPGTLWQDGVMIGLGHGGIEAMGFIAVLTAATISSLMALRGTDLTTLDLEPAQLAAIGKQMDSLFSSPWLLFVPLLERILAIGLHVILSLLVWECFDRRNLLYLLAAILYHALVDGTLVFAGQYIQNGWLLEVLLLVLLLPGIIWMWRRSSSMRAGRPDHVRPVPTQLSLFIAALGKELLQQWRTKRVLVVASVFLLFGLGSPLIAKFTPELLGSIEGAEQFADLIPEPSDNDALEQYLKNLSQFGFILAVLLGMGSVAGEKEIGTMAMILSKPMPRWAFLLSKFAAQALVYALGFLLASLGAYYYTMILFDGFAFGPFMFGNLLMLLWLLVFAAVALLGSTIARSTGGAAGIALGASVLLLLAGSLPNIGTFAPAGLLAWAGQLGISVEPGANGGALVANVVLILVCLITAVAVFETQEI